MVEEYRAENLDSYVLARLEVGKDGASEWDGRTIRDRIEDVLMIEAGDELARRRNRVTEVAEWVKGSGGEMKHV